MESLNKANITLLKKKLVNGLLDTIQGLIIVFIEHIHKPFKVRQPTSNVTCNRIYSSSTKLELCIVFQCQQHRILLINDMTSIFLCHF